MTTRTLGNGHVTRMSPDRGHCRGSGLNDVHRGVGGTVVTVSSPYAQLMAHNASLSIPAALNLRVARSRVWPPTQN